MADDGFIEAGSSASLKQSLLEHLDLDELRLTENRSYQDVIRECSKIHKELLDRETKGDLVVDNPALIGNYLGKLRLNANKLFIYMNIYIDVLSDLEREYAAKRQQTYKEAISQPKGSPSGAEKHAREVTRIDESKIKVIENNIQQVKNEFERYNGICMYLHSRMKDFNTERIMG